MNKNKVLIIFLALIVVAAGAFALNQKNLFHTSSHQHAGKDIYYCPMHPTYTSDRPGTCPICNMNLVKREDETNEKPAEGLREVTVKEIMSMKPGEICMLHKCKHGQCMIKMTEEIARLGKCPHCGEDLGVIIKDAMPQGYSGVKLTEERQQLIGLKTSTVKKMPMTKVIRTVGRIAYDPQLYQAEEEFTQGIQALKKAQSGSIDEIKEQAAKLVESSRLKLKLSGLSDELISEVEQAGKPDRSLLYGEVGGSVWLYAPVYEYEIPLIKAGEKVEVDVPSVPGKKFEGKIRAIDSVLDPMTRSVRIRAVLENPDGFLKPEMYVNANLRINLGDVLAVPDEAVFKTGEANIVFVRQSDGRFDPREVSIGAQSEGFYEIKSGLADGETVVTSGNFLIDSESRLKAALQGMGSNDGGHRHGG